MPERGHGFDRGFVETLGWNSHRVLGRFGVGEGNEAEAEVWYGFNLQLGSNHCGRGCRIVRLCARYLYER